MTSWLAYAVFALGSLRMISHSLVFRFAGRYSVVCATAMLQGYPEHEVRRYAPGRYVALRSLQIDFGVWSPARLPR